MHSTLHLPSRERSTLGPGQNVARQGVWELANVREFEGQLVLMLLQDLLALHCPSKFVRREPNISVYLASYCMRKSYNSFALSVSSEDHCSCFLFNGYSIERSYKLHFKPLARNII